MTTPKVFRVPDGIGHSIFTEKAQADRYANRSPDVKDEAGDRAVLIDPQAWALAAKTVHDDQPLWVWVADASGETLVKLQAFLTAYLAAATTAKDKNLAEVAYEPQFSTDWEREDYRRRKLGLPGLGPRVLVQPEAQLRLSGTEDAGVRALVERAEVAITLGERTGARGSRPENIYNVAADLLAALTRRT